MIKRSAIISVSVMMFAGSNLAGSASAQEKTREQVRQELVEAKRNGLDFVTDTSYPEISPLFAQQVAKLKGQRRDSGTGGAMPGKSDAGTTDRSIADPAVCAGPVSFCNVYFGS
ncbi:uncharacterized protein DUF4148 [Trinickia symbiotica]|uniref:DUF4148 domain-containing protein n=1 Tax=Trinickia symbiotica TaxID=863227 RepID=A0A2N7X8P2_9BURK|nr:DUF4148 domain-containing protein [Trinickia symbiotica]PMS38004.1 DUF4148 domain-containing protein [Trinickia symbiotica]PPK47347.1 uncharacterized protein DUF4148 [Trinickia symbiotica]